MILFKNSIKYNALFLFYVVNLFFFLIKNIYYLLFKTINNSLQGFFIIQYMDNL